MSSTQEHDCNLAGSLANELALLLGCASTRELVRIIRKHRLEEAVREDNSNGPLVTQKIMEAFHTVREHERQQTRCSLPLETLMYLTLIFAAMLAAGRIWLGFNVEPDAFSWPQVYKDVAHLFMGGLFVSWWYNRVTWDIAQFSVRPEFRQSLFLFMTWWEEQPYQWNLFWLLCVLEVVVAVASRM